MILAPLTKGGNLPFRRLCVEHGARVTMSEMAYSRQVCRRSKSELALLRKHPTEPCFGVQLAASRPEEAVRAGMAAVERGASFIDLNCGCPIHDVVRRGMGATLLRRPAALARLVEHMVRELPVPVTVKIRSGWAEDEVNAFEVARLVEEAGAAALSVHGRTREQRYTKAADWELIARLVRERTIPIIGNGDILTWYEARARQEESGCASIMIGRGALMKPWIFREITEGQGYEPSAEERVGIYFHFATLLKEHFRIDDKGRQRTMNFLPWHLGFFARYRPYPRERWGDAARRHPLLQTRHVETEELSLLERCLRDPRAEMHVRLADELWASTSSEDAVQRFSEVAAEVPPVVADADEVATAHG